METAHSNQVVKLNQTIRSLENRTNDQISLKNEYTEELKGVKRKVYELSQDLAKVSTIGLQAFTPGRETKTQDETSDYSEDIGQDGGDEPVQQQTRGSSSRGSRRKHKGSRQPYPYKGRKTRGR